MKKIFCCTSAIELAPFRSLLERHDIPYLVKNEYAMGALGEIPVNECWPQLWVLDDRLQSRARHLCLELETQIKSQSQDWVCSFCGESNADSFEICWHCEALPSVKP